MSRIYSAAAAKQNRRSPGVAAGVTGRQRAVGHAYKAFFSPRARIVRFAITGGLAGLLQLVLLGLLTKHGWQALPANAAAFLLSAQFNFVLSSLLTWRDRLTKRSPVRRWLAFHGAIALMAMVNLGVFAVMRLVLPDIAASAAGICAAALGNFCLGDRLIFRTQTRSAVRISGRRVVERAA